MSEQQTHRRRVSRESVQPPEPPRMRVGDGVSKSSKLGFYLFMCTFCFGWGIFCGMRIAGG